MHVHALPDAAGFLVATEALRAQDPILTNVVGSVAQSVVDGRSYESAVWLVVREGGDVVGCAMRTGSFNAVLSPMPAPAAEAVGRWMAQHDANVPGLTGPESVVSDAARGLGRTGEVRMREVARVLDPAFPAPSQRPVPGQAVPAGAAHLDLLVGWLADFEIEAGIQRFATRAHTAAQVDDRRLWLWVVDDEPVALGGHAPLVSTPGGTVGRIGPIYTPPERRRRGYGSAITRAVAGELQPRCDRIMLFADAANRDSNSIYEAMGFVVVGELVEAGFR